MALLAPLAGCATVRGGSDVGVSNFALVPERLGWNVTETARFTLSVKPTLLGATPDYAVDPHFAIEEVFLHEKGLALGGNHRTRNPLDLDLKIWRNGTEVGSADLGAGNESVDLTITLPDTLKDSEYQLEIKLFKVGWVRSAAFRVNVP